MKFKINSLPIVESNGRYGFYCIIPNNMLDKFNKLKDKVCSVEVKEYKDNRSLSANGYLWSLINQLAQKINIPKGDMYVKMIKRYGKYHTFVVKDEALTELIKAWDHNNTSVEHTESLCDITNSFRSKGIMWHEIMCHEGSSGYNTLEFSKLLEGLISEAELIGICTMTPKEVEQLMNNYDGG